MIYAVIMAGGSGTRFWPKSTKALPKQFLNLFGDATMLQNTVRRIEPIIPQERVLVVTNEQYVDIVKEQLPKVPDQNVVSEPVAKNTAPCVAIAAELLAKKDPEAVMVVLPADHHITEPDRFLEVVEAAVEKAKSGPYLVTIGINPSRPETGFGYIHANASESETKAGKLVHPVRAFKEKPDLKTAEEFVASGDYFWNSGMFVWKASTVLKEIQMHLPEMYAEVKAASSELYTDMHDAAVNDFYHNCESISIDYGIMEQSKSVFVVPGEFGWNDVGSWTAVYELAEKNAAGNAIQALHVATAEAENNLVVSNSEKMIALVGVENLAVIETEKALLVCDLNSAQGVKQIVEFLKGNEANAKFL